MGTPVKDEKEPSLAFGGQALIEGVMMRSGSHVVLCVRQPSGGIVTHSESFTPLSKRYRVLGLPFLRGIVALFESMYYGVKGVFFSANVALEEEEEELGLKEAAIILVSVLVLSSFFVIVPFLITTFLRLEGVLFNVVESLTRLTMFVLYLYLVSRWGEFSRVLQYHGAEHKAINAHEAGAPMDVESVSGFTRMNPRCGTSFLFIVILMSVVLFSLITSSSFYLRLAYRVILIPVLGALSYELLKLSDKHRDNPVMQVFTAPGLAFQRLTTKEPDGPMIEVAVKALEEVARLESESKA